MSQQPVPLILKIFIILQISSNKTNLLIWNNFIYVNLLLRYKNILLTVHFVNNVRMSHAQGRTLMGTQRAKP